MSTFMLFTLLVQFVTSDPSIYWYTNTNLANNQRIYEQDSDLFYGFYFCCNQFYFDSNGTFTHRNDSALIENIKYFQNKVDKIYIVGSIDQKALERFNGFIPSSSLIQFAEYMMSINVNGCIIDFEPDTSNQRLAEQYNTFLSTFQAIINEKYSNSLSIGMDIANWGILDEYALYSTANLSIYTSMSTTYHGYNISKNEQGIEEELTYFPAVQLRVGICSMIAGNPDSVTNCGWNQQNLNQFLTYLKSDDVNLPRVDIWRADIDQNGLNTSEWFMNSLKTFVSYNTT